MLFSSRLPLSSLIEMCRVLRHYLSAGLSLRDVFRQQAAKGPLAVRPVAGRIAEALGRGDGLEQALKRETAAFPPLLLSLAVVGEQTGMLPEVFGELERYYQRQQQLRRQFWAASAWPLIQFVLAIFVITGLILILGWLPSAHTPDGKPYDPVGLGLVGPSGALIFLGVVFGTLLALGVVYLLLRRGMRQRAAVDSFLLAVPALGPCLRALALARFCLALRLTTETAMPIGRALRLSLRATGNSAFTARSETVEAGVRAGDDLTSSLARSRLFPGDFQNMIAVAEESGRLTDVLKQQADHYHEEAGRRMAVLTAVASYGVWAFVGALIIVVIFRLYLSYIGMLNSIG
ncbi:MAG TPA: type II secretion system F family protein [Gemmataceae bacterium]|jgi:type IV pilus assembly protein PilC|nr:type II secretion system F family protein [Gemmataceae bacterium]